CLTSEFSLTSVANKYLYFKYVQIWEVVLRGCLELIILLRQGVQRGWHSLPSSSAYNDNAFARWFRFLPPLGAIKGILANRGLGLLYHSVESSLPTSCIFSNNHIFPLADAPCFSGRINSARDLPINAPARI